MPPYTLKPSQLTLSVMNQTRRGASGGEKDEAQPDPVGEFYQKHMRQIYAYHLMRTSKVDDAQDLTSQTFLAALEGLRKQPTLLNNSPWLFGIAKHKLADHYRKRHSQIPLDSIGAHSHPGPSPEEVATTRIEFDRVVEALRSLAPQQAEAIILRIFGGLSAAQVGRTMHKSEAAVKMLVHRGLRNLQGKIPFFLEVSK